MTQKLGDFIVKRGGSLDPRKFKNEIFELLSIPAFDKGAPEIVEGAKIGSAKKLVEPNDVLLSKIVPHIRRCWIVPEFRANRQIASGEWIQFRSAELEPEYVRHFFISDPFHSKFMKTVTGVGGSLLRARPAEVANIEIPLPTRSDQIRIAFLLTKVERLVAQRKHHLQQLDDLSKSVFLDMFGNPITNPKEFPVKFLSEFYINPKDGTKCGPFGSALKKGEMVESGIPVWNMDNIDSTGRMVSPFRMWITEEKYRELSTYAVFDGDIIISRAGTVGKMCVAKMNGVPSIISTNLIRLRLGLKLRPLHFVLLMTYCKGRVGRLKTGPDGAFTHMNTGILDKLEIPCPPVDLQDQFAAIYDKIERIKTYYQQSLSELENLYNVLSQKAFNGELDLSRVPLESKPEIQDPQKKEKAADTESIAQVQRQSIKLTWPAGLETLIGAVPDENAPDAEWERYRALYNSRTKNESSTILSVVNMTRHFLNEYFGLLANQDRFVIDDFLEAALKKHDELSESSISHEVDLLVYEEVRAWVYQTIEKGRLTQRYDDANNHVQLFKAKD